jgi:hypothetical protein
VAHALQFVAGRVYRSNPVRIEKGFRILIKLFKTTHKEDETGEKYQGFSEKYEKLSIGRLDCLEQLSR